MSLYNTCFRHSATATKRGTMLQISMIWLLLLLMSLPPWSSNNPLSGVIVVAGIVVVNNYFLTTFTFNLCFIAINALNRPHRFHHISLSSSSFSFSFSVSTSISFIWQHVVWLIVSLIGVLAEDRGLHLIYIFMLGFFYSSSSTHLLGHRHKICLYI